MTFYERHKCHKRAFYDIYDGHKIFQKCGNMIYFLLLSPPQPLGRVRYPQTNTILISYKGPFTDLQFTFIGLTRGTSQNIIDQI